MISEKRQEMADIMIKTFGFEDPRTIEFIAYCEEMEETENNDGFLEFLLQLYYNC